jgi:ribose transport system permease protein
MQKKDLGLAVLIIIVGAIVYLRNPLFLSPINLGNTANLIGLFGLFAIGHGFVIMTGGIDLSVGSVIALLGVLFVDMVGKLGVPWPVAVAIIIALGALMGLAHGLLITRFKMQPFVVTLCGLLIYRGVARGYTAEATAGFPFGASFPQLEWLTIGRTLGVPHSFIAMILVAVVMWLVLHRSVFGRHLYAVGKNEEAARFSGIKTGFVITSAYVICSVLAAIAASDAICCMRLGKRHRGQDHIGAVALLKSVKPDGSTYAKDLQAALSVKDPAHYGENFISDAKLRATMRAATRLVQAAEAALVRM